ncbi:hypothetical protein [Brucella intermedia]|uniref:hypothetical protein n=1 Tax=Brucella intermedia TaxID=94625 RepID=UPI00235E0878|nr:hypothetical protein [Brucella intermedia]
MDDISPEKNKFYVVFNEAGFLSASYQSAAYEKPEDIIPSDAIEVNEAMASQPVRTQRIFTTANTFRSDHELWPLLVQMATDLFGEERAAGLLRG